MGVVILIIAGLIISEREQNLPAIVSTERTPPAAQERAPSLEDSTPADDDTTIEEFCTSQKQAHITNCGQGLPGDDFNCRNQEADEVFQTCMSNTKIEDSAQSY